MVESQGRTVIDETYKEMTAPQPLPDGTEGQPQPARPTREQFFERVPSQYQKLANEDMRVSMLPTAQSIEDRQITSEDRALKRAAMEADIAYTEKRTDVLGNEPMSRKSQTNAADVAKERLEFDKLKDKRTMIEKQLDKAKKELEDFDLSKPPKKNRTGLLASQEEKDAATKAYETAIANHTAKGEKITKRIETLEGKLDDIVSKIESSRANSSGPVTPESRDDEIARAIIEEVMGDRRYSEEEITRATTGLLNDRGKFEAAKQAYFDRGQ